MSRIKSGTTSWGLAELTIPAEPVEIAFSFSLFREEGRGAGLSAGWRAGGLTAPTPTPGEGLIVPKTLSYIDPKRLSRTATAMTTCHTPSTYRFFLSSQSHVSPPPKMGFGVYLVSPFARITQ